MYFQSQEYNARIQNKAIKAGRSSWTLGRLEKQEKTRTLRTDVCGARKSKTNAKA
jgi:hypothetical protein